MAQQHIPAVLYGTGVNAGSPSATEEANTVNLSLALFTYLFIFFIPRHNSVFNTPSILHQYPFTASEQKQKVNISFPVPLPS